MISIAFSLSMALLIVAIMPFLKRYLMMSVALTPMALESDLIVTGSGISILPSVRTGPCAWPGMFSRFFMSRRRCLRKPVA